MRPHLLLFATAVLFALAACMHQVELSFPVPPMPLGGSQLSCVAQRCTGWQDEDKPVSDPRVACQTDGDARDERWYTHVFVVYPNGALWAPKAALSIYPGDEAGGDRATAECRRWYRAIDKLQKKK